MIHMSNIREDWLMRAVEELRPLFESKAGVTLPEFIRVSVGFGFGTKGKSTKTLGQCWSTGSADDQHSHIFIAPMMNDPFQILATLVHELIHAHLDCEGGHGPKFRKVAVKMGLEGSMRATHAGDALRFELAEIVDRLGGWAAGRLMVGTGASSGPKKQTNRYHKVICPDTEDCGYVVRVVQKHIDIGLPTCPCGNEMELEN